MPHTQMLMSNCGKLASGYQMATVAPQEPIPVFLSTGIHEAKQTGTLNLNILCFPSVFLQTLLQGMFPLSAAAAGIVPRYFGGVVSEYSQMIGPRLMILLALCKSLVQAQ